jgi:hypothetical protein
MLTSKMGKVDLQESVSELKIDLKEYAEHPTKPILQKKLYTHINEVGIESFLKSASDDILHKFAEILVLEKDADEKELNEKGRRSLSKRIAEQIFFEGTESVLNHFDKVRY